MGSIINVPTTPIRENLDMYNLVMTDGPEPISVEVCAQLDTPHQLVSKLTKLVVSGGDTLPQAAAKLIAGHWNQYDVYAACSLFLRGMLTAQIVADIQTWCARYGKAVRT